MYNYSMRKLHNGFTLLELLVVIAVIGILISMGVVAFSTAQAKGRDSKRRGDVKAMQSAFEQYYAENTGYAACATMATAEYLPNGLPVDPKNSGDFVYSCQGDADSYCACAKMEDTDSGNASGIPAGADCAFTASSTHYCLGNLQ